MQSIAIGYRDVWSIQSVYGDVNCRISSGQFRRSMLPGTREILQEREKYSNVTPSRLKSNTTQKVP